MFHASRNFRSLRGCQILVRGQLLLHLATFWRVESLLDFFAWSKRRARLVWCARASAQVRRGGKQSEDEHSPHWSDAAHAHVAAQPNPAMNSRRLICLKDIQTPQKRGAAHIMHYSMFHLDPVCSVAADVRSGNKRTLTPHFWRSALRRKDGVIGRRACG